MPSSLTVVVELEPEAAARLERIAEASQKPVKDLVQRAVNQYLDYDAWIRAEIQAGIDEADRGEVIPHEEVKRWAESLRTERELLPPR